jgi:hypothetical protein
MSIMTGTEEGTHQQAPLEASRECSSRPAQNQSRVAQHRDMDAAASPTVALKTYLQVAEAGTRRGENVDRETAGVKANRSALYNMFFISLLLYVPSCAQPQLIENSKLNQLRIHDIVSRASDASGLRVNYPLSVKLVNRSELHEILRGTADATMQSDVWAARQDGHSAMGFSAGGAKAVEESVALFSRSVAGIYVSRNATLYIVSEQARSEKGGIYLNSLGAFGDELTLAHEAIHALQHMHYPEIFEPDERVWQQQTDAAIALQAAKEGDASLWAAQSFGFLGRARDPEEVLASSRESAGSPLSDAPTLVHERTVFPYTYGYRFAYHEGRKGLKAPPASTEQVIHVGSGGRRAFLAIDLSDFATKLEAMGCRVLFQDTMGELTLSLWLRSLDSTTDQGVWDGWDGDRWIAAECEKSREVAWLTSWDTEQDAREFETAFAVIAEDFQRRAKLKSPLAAERNEREVVVVSEGLWPQIGQLKRLANRARVMTRGELAAHYARAK